MGATVAHVHRCHTTWTGVVAVHRTSIVRGPEPWRATTASQVAREIRRPSANTHASCGPSVQSCHCCLSAVAMPQHVLGVTPQVFN
jgi:hypothetical protein